MNRIVLGATTAIGGAVRNVHLDLDILLRTRLLVQASSGQGKSWLLRRICEQAFGKVQVIMIDPEGEFASLRERFGYVLVGPGGETPADPRSAGKVAEKLLELRASAVCDIFELKHNRSAWVRAFLEALIDAPKHLWHPALVIVDECHKFSPEGKAGQSEASDAMIDLATAGRKRGFAACFATQRLGKLRKDASAELLNRLVGGTFEDLDIDRAADELSVARADRAVFSQEIKTLDPGLFFALGRAVSKDRILFRVGSVETTHPEAGSIKHSVGPPPAPEAIRKLLPQLADLPQQAEAEARTLADLRQEVRRLKGELRARPEATREVPVADQKAIDRAVQNAVKEATAPYQRAVQERDRILNHVMKTLRSLGEQYQTLPGPVEVVEKISERQGVMHVGVDQALPGCDRSVPIPQHVTLANGDITAAQMKLIAALAEMEAIGRAHVRKATLAAMAGVSSTSGGYFNNLGRLRSAGLIDYPAPDNVALTDDGRRVAPEVRPPADSGEMLQRCLRVITRPQGEILTALWAVYPKAMQKNELAEQIRVSPTSGGYFNNLGSLRTAGLIDYPQAGYARCSDWLFIEG